MKNLENLFGKYMKSLRKHGNLTPKEASTYLGVSEEELRDWEEGRGVPPLELSPKFSRLYQISMGEWLEILDSEKFEK